MNWTKVSLWYLRNCEGIWVVWPGIHIVGIPTFIFLGVISGWDSRAMFYVIFFFGTIFNIGAYLFIKAVKAHLMTLKDSEDREEALKLMTKVILRRM